MDEELPLYEEVYVLKEGRKLGPFIAEDLLDGLEAGDFTEDDLCLRAGSSEYERLREILDWDHEDDWSEDEEEDLDWEEDETKSVTATPKKKTPPPRARTPHPERLLYSGHPSIITYPLSFSALVAGVTGGIWLYPIDATYTLIGMAIAAAGLIRISLVRFTHDYYIRQHRLEVITGLLARSSREVRISDIRSINVSCRGLPGIFGVGTVDFITSGDSPEVSFKNVWAARKIKKLIRQLQDASLR